LTSDPEKHSRSAGERQTKIQGLVSIKW